jgi:RNA polymerase sigma-70 factor (ECF subfamily)
MPDDKQKTDDSRTAMRDMASHWVASQPIVSAFLTSNVVDLHHAEDLIQETAKAVAENYRSFDATRPFTPWVLAIARNQLHKYYRTRSRDRLVFSEATLISTSAAFQRIADETEERRLALRSCLDQVKGKSRHVLHLRYKDNMKTKDIGNHLGVAASTISVMLFRARVLLEECIRKQLAKEAH